jgi:hypothetical protein
LFIKKEEQEMRKFMGVVLGFVLVVMGSLPFATTVFADYRDDPFFYTSEWLELQARPDLAPGDVLHSGAPPVRLLSTTSFGGELGSPGYESHRGVSILLDDPEFVAEVYEGIIVGDSLEFTGAYITYGDGTVISGERTIYVDGEHIIVKADPTRDNMKAEFFICWNEVKGTPGLDSWIAPDIKDGGWLDTLNYLDGRYVDTIATRPAPTATGSVHDLMLPSYDGVRDFWTKYHAYYKDGETKSEPNPTRFSDVPLSHWAYGYIAAAAEKGLIQGMGDGRFEPSGTLTRAQIDQIIYNGYGNNSHNYLMGGSVADVPESAWYYNAVSWAIITGLSESQGSLYRPDAPATREHVVDMLYRLAQQRGVDLPKVADAKSFSDIALATNQDAILVLQQAGIIDGKPGGIFDPMGNVTRAEVAKMICLFEQIDGLGL